MGAAYNVRLPHKAAARLWVRPRDGDDPAFCVYFYGVCLCLFLLPLPKLLLPLQVETCNPH
jgi:hypothetical protein